MTHFESWKLTIFCVLLRDGTTEAASSHLQLEMEERILTAALPMAMQATCTLLEWAHTAKMVQLLTMMKSAPARWL